MSRHRGSFHEDLNQLLQRFAHRGTPAALNDQLREAKPREQKFRRRSRSFHLNQDLFDRSQN